MTTDITSGLSYRYRPNLGRATALERIRELCVNEQGRLWQAVGGDVHFDDFAACKAQCAVTGTEPTYSDQGGVGDLPYTDPILSTGRDLLINRCTVRLNNQAAHTTTSDNSASQTAHGIRAAQFDLILASEADADTFASVIVSRFKDQRKHVKQITVNPKTDSDWWDELDARDIGDRVNVERQPGGTGTVVSTASVIEGESWTWHAAKDRMLFTFYFSPAACYDGFTYP